LGRFSGEGLTCSDQPQRSAHRIRGRGNSLKVDADTAPVSPAVAAGNAALLRQWKFLRKSGLPPPYPAEGQLVAHAALAFPPKVTNTMAASDSSAAELVSGNEANLRMGAAHPADVDAIKLFMFDPQVDVSSDESPDDDSLSPSAP
jgi:hypothetical protein